MKTIPQDIFQFHKHKMNIFEEMVISHVNILITKNNFYWFMNREIIYSSKH